jgi:MoaA/NifB/PqqE/SkfB family radical SAM enzyme
MSNDLFNKIIAELVDINNVIGLNPKFHIFLGAYNEPLADENFINMVKEIKNALPNIKLHINTNGDYLNKELLDCLLFAGLDRLLISSYIDSQAPNLYNYNAAHKSVSAWIDKLHLQGKIITSSNNTSCNFIGRYYKNKSKKSIWVSVRCENHTLTANYRGGAVPDSAPVVRSDNHNLMCINPFVTFSVYFDGKVTLCTNIRPDFSGHFDFISGDLNRNTISEIFNSQISRNFRLNLCNKAFELPPCKRCTINIVNQPDAIFVELEPI